MQGSALYNLAFAAVICVVCAIFVSSSAVSLRDREAANRMLDMQGNVLMVAGLAAPDERVSAEDVTERFRPIRQVVIDLATGEPTDIEPDTFNQRLAEADPSSSNVAPPNDAGLTRIGHQALVYELRAPDESLELVVLPVRGLGLWGFLYGFIALDADLGTIRGLSFYEHKETPGLGGEVDNQRWRGLWDGRKAFDASGTPEIAVARGVAGSVSEDPHRVDALAGATMTSRGVTNLLRFWLGEQGFGPYFNRLRERTIR